MRDRLHQTIWAFEDIMEQITDIKEVLIIYEERLRESAEEPRTQSILRGQIKQLELVEKNCEQFAESMDILLRDYIHGRIDATAQE